MLSRKLRTSKDEIIDKVMMPFLQKTTHFKALVEPSSHTPRLAIAAYKDIAAHYNVNVNEYIFETCEEHKASSNYNMKTNLSSTEILVAYNMISQT